MQISSTNNVNQIIDNKKIQQKKQSQPETVNDRVTSGSEKVSGSLWRAMTQKIDPCGARSYLLKTGLGIGLKPSDINNLVKVMEKGSVETSNIEMLFGLVKDGDLSKRTIKFICADGMMSESMEKDVVMIYEAKADGVDVNDRYVPIRANKDEALANSEVGDVFSVGGEKNVFIKNKDGEAEQLKMDRDMYLSLFPAAERFASAQNKAGDCYYISAVNAMMDNPNSRARVLQCFEQDGENVKIKFPNSDYVYVSEDAKLKNSAEKNKLLVGSMGMKLLEHAYGYSKEADAISQYRESQTRVIGELKEKLASASDTETKKDLEYRLKEQERSFKTFEYDRASKNPKLVFQFDSDCKIRTDKDGVGIFVNMDNLAKTTGMYYKSTADYYRAEGGFPENVFRDFGFDSSYAEFGTPEAKEILSHFDDADDYIINGGTKSGRSALERKLDRSKSMYSGHAYRIIPFKDKAGNEMYRVSNPWNGSHDSVMTYDDMAKFFREISVAKVKE